MNDIFEDIEQGNIEAVKSKIKENPKKNVNLVDTKGYSHSHYSLLHYAIMHSQNELVSLLLSYPNIDINYVNGYSSNALLLSIEEKNIFAFEELLKNPKTNVNYVIKGLKDLRNFPLMRLCNMPVTEENINTLDIYFNMVSLLLERKDVDINLNKVHKLNYTPLSLTIKNFNKFIFDLLINRPDLNINADNYIREILVSFNNSSYKSAKTVYEENTFLYFFDKIVNKSTIKDINKLLNKASSYIYEEDKKDYSVFSVLDVTEDYDLVEHILITFIKKGYNFKYTNKDGLSILSVYLQTIESYNNNCYKYIQALLKNGVDVNSKFSVIADTYQLLVNGVITINDFKDLINLYLSYNLKIKYNKYYPILITICKTYTKDNVNYKDINEALEFLLQKGVDPNYSKDSGSEFLPLALTCYHKDIEKIKILLRYKANPNITVNNESLFSRICKSGQKEIFDLFVHIPNLKIDISPTEIKFSNGIGDVYQNEELDDELDHFPFDYEDTGTYYSSRIIRNTTHIDYEDTGTYYSSRIIRNTTHIKRELKNLNNPTKLKINQILDDIKD